MLSFICFFKWPKQWSFWQNILIIIILKTDLTIYILYKQQQKQPSIMPSYNYMWSNLFSFNVLRYWKISLLVHPDKCSHPQANQAFIKLNKAFKELQDPEKVSLPEGWLIVEVKVAAGGIFHFLSCLSFIDITQWITLSIPLGWFIFCISY